MKIDVLEKKKDKLKISLSNLTFVNLLNENLWKGRIGYSAYAVDHPYLSKPVLVVNSKDPKRSLLDAAEQIILDVKELRKKFQHAKK
jgi:DNA-directed RNA polymerase subunit L